MNLDASPVTLSQIPCTQRNTFASIHTTVLSRPIREACVENITVMEKELTCAICLSVAKDPRSLPCSHFYCRPCLESVFAQVGPVFFFLFFIHFRCFFLLSLSLPAFLSPLWSPLTPSIYISITTRGTLSLSFSLFLSLSFSLSLSYIFMVDHARPAGSGVCPLNLYYISFILCFFQGKGSCPKCRQRTTMRQSTSDPIIRNLCNLLRKLHEVVSSELGMDTLSQDSGIHL